MEFPGSGNNREKVAGECENVLKACMELKKHGGGEVLRLLKEGVPTRYYRTRITPTNAGKHLSPPA